MAQEVILAEQNFTSTFNESYGYCYPVTNVPFELVVGKTYSVVWDVDEYTCEAMDGGSLAAGAVLVGNATSFGLDGNNEPFLIAMVGTEMIIACLDDTESTSHTIAIYTAEEETEDGSGNVLGDLFQEIADAIRTKTGNTTKMAPADFPDEILSIAAGSGGGNSDGVYWKQEVFLPSTINSAPGNVFFFGGKIHVVCKDSGTSTYGIWRLDNDKWTYITALPFVSYFTEDAYVEFDGELHMFEGEGARHYKYNGTSWVALNTLPANHQTSSDDAFVINDELYCFLGTGLKQHIYKWDSSTDTWTLVVENASGVNVNKGLVVLNQKAYFINAATNLYCFDGEAVTLLCAINSNITDVKFLLTDGVDLFTAPAAVGYQMRKFVDNQWELLDVYSIAGTSCCVMVDGRVHAIGYASPSLMYKAHLSCALS